MKDYEIKGVTLNAKEMADICHYYETQLLVDRITREYPNLFSVDNAELLANAALREMRDYGVSEDKAIDISLQNDDVEVTLKRNVTENSDFVTFDCWWSWFNDALEECYPDMSANEFCKEYTPEMGEKLYQWLLENDYIEEETKKGE